jgi:hypothetical protein
MLPGLLLVLPGALLGNMPCRLGDGKRVICCQEVPGSVRAIRVVWNTRVFQTETRVVADGHYTLKGSRICSGGSVNEISCYCPRGCG